MQRHYCSSYCRIANTALGLQISDNSILGLAMHDYIVHLDFASDTALSGSGTAASGQRTCRQLWRRQPTFSHALKERTRANERTAHTLRTNSRPPHRQNGVLRSSRGRPRLRGHGRTRRRRAHALTRRRRTGAHRRNRRRPSHRTSTTVSSTHNTRQTYAIQPTVNHAPKPDATDGEARRPGPQSRRGRRSVESMERRDMRNTTLQLLRDANTTLE